MEYFTFESFANAIDQYILTLFPAIATIVSSAISLVIFFKALFRQDRIPRENLTVYNIPSSQNGQGYDSKYSRGADFALKMSTRSQIENYHQQSISQARLSFNMSMVFSAIGFMVIITSLFYSPYQNFSQINSDMAKSEVKENDQSPQRLTGKLSSPKEEYEENIISAYEKKQPESQIYTEKLSRNSDKRQPWPIGIISGAIIEVISALFIVQSNKTRKMMNDFFEKLIEDKNIEASIAICLEIEDKNQKDELIGEISRKLCGINK